MSQDKILEIPLATVILICVLSFMLGVTISYDVSTDEEPQTITILERAVPVYKYVYVEKEVVVKETAPVEPVVEIKQPITKNFNVMSSSGYSSDELATALSTENHKGLEPYINTFVKAEEMYGVNSFYLMCKFGLESGWGKYTSGKNNIGGWTKDDGSFKDFASVDECILYAAENISTEYKDAVGTNISDVCERYCPEDDYLDKLLQIMVERNEVMQGKECL